MTTKNTVCRIEMRKKVADKKRKFYIFLADDSLGLEPYFEIKRNTPINGYETKSPRAFDERITTASRISVGFP